VTAPPELPPSEPADDLIEEKPSRAGWLLWFTRATLIAGVIGLAWLIYDVGPRQIWSTMLAIGPWFAVMLGLEALSTVLDAWALHVQLVTKTSRPRFLHVLQAQLGGRAVNLVTPMGTLGEAGKFAALSAESAPERVAAALVITNLTSIVMTIAVIVLGAPIAVWGIDLPAPWPNVALVASAVLLVLGLGLWRLLAGGKLVRALRSRRAAQLITEHRAVRWSKRIGRITRVLRDRRSRRARWLAVGATVGGNVLGWLSLWVAIAATGHYTTVGQMAALISVGALIGVIASPIPLGIGVAEGGYAVLYTALGMGATRGVSIALARRLVTIVYAAIGLPVALAARAPKP
jgi:uncharacterized protein (TIRG00374 family)